MSKYEAQKIDYVEEILFRFTYGQTIPKEWLDELFNIKRKESMTINEFNQAAFKFMSCMESVKEELLTEHKMMLNNVHGKGYQIVMPGNQADTVLTNAKQVMKKTISLAEKQLSNVNYALIDDAEARKVANSLGSLAAIRAFSRKEMNVKRLT